MTKLYLITGFLGAGKTTFLTGLIETRADRRVRVIVNEFGAFATDDALLAGYAARVRAIAGGSIFCVCRLSEFETTLSDALCENPDELFVEASGLSDPRSIREITAPYERAGALAYQGAICLVDAPRFEKLLDTARAVRRQLAVADIVLLNKCDLVSEDALARAEETLRGVCLARIVRTTFARVPEGLIDSLTPRDGRAEAGDTRPDLTTQGETLLIDPAMTLAQLNDLLRMLAEDTYRIKGILALADGRYLVDCVGTDLRVVPFDQPAAGENALALLAGVGMPLRQSLRAAAERYAPYVRLGGK